MHLDEYDFRYINVNQAIAVRLSSNLHTPKINVDNFMVFN